MNRAKPATFPLLATIEIIPTKKGKLVAFQVKVRKKFCNLYLDSFLQVKGQKGFVFYPQKSTSKTFYLALSYLASSKKGQQQLLLLWGSTTLLPFFQSLEREYGHHQGSKDAIYCTKKPLIIPVEVIGPKCQLSTQILYPKAI